MNMSNDHNKNIDGNNCINIVNAKYNDLYGKDKLLNTCKVENDLKGCVNKFLQGNRKTLMEEKCLYDDTLEKKSMGEINNQIDKKSKENKENIEEEKNKHSVDIELVDVKKVGEEFDKIISDANISNKEKHKVISINFLNN